jgi:mannose-6-phosphate isomerase-like protein (cupin superfamily)
VSRRRTLPIFLCLVAAGLAAFASAVAETAAAPAPVLDVTFGGGRITLPLSELAARVPLAQDQDFRLEELGRSAHTSQHVGAIRKAERPHRHDLHDQLVLLVRGQGTMRVGDETRPIAAGSLMFVPKGAVHAFTNTGPEPAIAYVVYTPPFDGKDRIQVP